MLGVQFLCLVPPLFKPALWVWCWVLLASPHSLSISPAVPRVPVDLTATSTGSEFINVSWLEPDIINGTIVHYLVNVRDGSQLISESVMVSDNFFMANSLLPFTNYTFEVAAVTGAGAGMSAVLTVATLQDGKG